MRTPNAAASTGLPPSNEPDNNRSLMRTQDARPVADHKAPN